MLNLVNITIYKYKYIYLYVLYIYNIIYYSVIIIIIIILQFIINLNFTKLTLWLIILWQVQRSALRTQILERATVMKKWNELVEENDERQPVDIPVSFNGTWAKRGFRSLTGVVFVDQGNTWYLPPSIGNIPWRRWRAQGCYHGTWAKRGFTSLTGVVFVDQGNTWYLPPSIGNIPWRIWRGRAQGWYHGTWTATSDIPVSFNGTWAKRGFGSLTGVVFVWILVRMWRINLLWMPLAQTLKNIITTKTSLLYITVKINFNKLFSNIHRCTPFWPLNDLVTNVYWYSNYINLLARISFFESKMVLFHILLNQFVLNPQQLFELLHEMFECHNNHSHYKLKSSKPQLYQYYRAWYIVKVLLASRFLRR